MTKIGSWFFTIWGTYMNKKTWFLNFGPVTFFAVYFQHKGKMYVAFDDLPNSNVLCSITPKRLRKHITHHYWKHCCRPTVRTTSSRWYLERLMLKAPSKILVHWNFKENLRPCVWWKWHQPAITRASRTGRLRRKIWSKDLPCTGEYRKSHRTRH